MIRKKFLLKKIANGNLYRTYQEVNSESSTCWKILGDKKDCGNFAIALNKILKKRGLYLTLLETVFGNTIANGKEKSLHIILQYKKKLIDSMGICSNNQYSKIRIFKKYIQKTFPKEISSKIQYEELLNHLSIVNKKDIYFLVPKTNTERIKDIVKILQLESKKKGIDVENLKIKN